MSKNFCPSLYNAIIKYLLHNRRKRDIVSLEFTYRSKGYCYYFRSPWVVRWTALIETYGTTDEVDHTLFKTSCIYIKSSKELMVLLFG